MLQPGLIGERRVLHHAYLTRGWQTFARARGLKGRSALHFKYDGLATLFVRVFGAGGLRVGCCQEDGSDDDELGLDDIHATSSGDGSSSGKSAGGSGYGEPPHRRARLREGDEVPCRRALVKREEGSD